MPFEAYLTANYEHPHENEMFAALVTSLMAKFKADPAPHILIGNIMFEGKDLDALFLQPTGITVIEMKSHGGRVTFFSSTPWKVGNIEVLGGSRLNPFLQVRDYRRGVSNFLANREKEILRTQRSIRWDQVSGVVLFGKNIEFDEYVLSRRNIT